MKPKGRSRKAQSASTSLFDWALDMEKEREEELGYRRDAPFSGEPDSRATLQADRDRPALRKALQDLVASEPNRLVRRVTKNPLGAAVPEQNSLAHVHGVDTVWRFPQQTVHAACHRRSSGLRACGISILLRLSDLASGLPLYMVCAGRFIPPSLQCA